MYVGYFNLRNSPRNAAAFHHSKTMCSVRPTLKWKAPSRRRRHSSFAYILFARIPSSVFLNAYILLHTNIFPRARLSAWPELLLSFLFLNHSTCFFSVAVTSSRINTKRPNKVSIIRSQASVR